MSSWTTTVYKRLTKNRNGSGMHTTERNANTDDAQCTPRFLYIAGLISGNTAARIERKMTVEAIALAQ